MSGVVPGEIVASVAKRIEKWAVRARPFPCKKTVGLLQLRTPGKEPANSPKRPALDARRDFIRHRFPKPDMHHPQAAKIAVLRAERSINQIHFLNQLGRD